VVVWGANIYFCLFFNIKKEEGGVCKRVGGAFGVAS
jgi:hypothetical protein